MLLCGPLEPFVSGCSFPNGFRIKGGAGALCAQLANYLGHLGFKVQGFQQKFANPRTRFHKVRDPAGCGAGFSWSSVSSTCSSIGVLGIPNNLDVRKEMRDAGV